MTPGAHRPPLIDHRSSLIAHRSMTNRGLVPTFFRLSRNAFGALHVDLSINY